MKKYLTFIILVITMLTATFSYAVETVTLTIRNQTPHDLIKGGSSIVPPMGNPPNEITSLGTSNPFTVTGERSNGSGIMVGVSYNVKNSPDPFNKIQIAVEFDAKGDLRDPPGCINTNLSSVRCYAQQNGNLNYTIITDEQNNKHQPGSK